ncbi:hypothetical protein GALMADRAFT_247952 [Galerina marginata CBS 339.88]|uniref:BTB domain-containing protein n=1 Tax=Galerina marginata (strain CBS 339.88) TaxID=685588 RepID=A0A067SX59_GALM3|nr:hypothetical protein GALMADRAFT_247952 [Galerina marginata CBS 339.88]
MSSNADDNEPSSSTSRPEIMLTQDEDYYLDNRIVIFEVECCLFRVPLYQFFNESPDFSDIHGLSFYPSNSGDPIRLEGVRQVDFRRLLKLLYPLPVSLQLSMSKDEWISVLTLSSEWRFLRLRNMAISELQRSLTSVEKICLGRERHISSWVIEGFGELVHRKDPLTDDEAIDLDANYVTTAYKLFRIRELRISGTRVFSVLKLIQETFKDTLESIMEEERTFGVPDDPLMLFPPLNVPKELTADEKERGEWVEKSYEEDRWEEERKKNKKEEIFQDLQNENGSRLTADDEKRTTLNMQLQESKGVAAIKKKKNKK